MSGGVLVSDLTPESAGTKDWYYYVSTREGYKAVEIGKFKKINKIMKTETMILAILVAIVFFYLGKYIERIEWNKLT
jgi:hypothetical protein